MEAYFNYSSMHLNIFVPVGGEVNLQVFEYYYIWHCIVLRSANRLRLCLTVMLTSDFGKFK